MAGKLALKTIELTVGKQVNISATIRNQSSLPDWDKIPKDAQDAFLSALSKADANVVDVTPEPETPVVPQTDEDYFNDEQFKSADE